MKLSKRTVLSLVLLLVAYLQTGAACAADRPKPTNAYALGLKTLAAPSFSAVPTSTSNNPLSVTGTAPAGSQVRIFVNGELLELATANGSGAFSANVPLFDGSNDLHATAWDGSEESAASSTSNTVYSNSLPRSQSGTISVDTVWTPSGGAYVLAGDLTIASGVEFRLMPGVEVRSAANYEIEVNGLLVAYGTASSGIALRSNVASPTKGSWKGVRVPGTGYVDLNYVTIEHAGNALWFTGGEGQIFHSTLRNNGNGAYVEANSSPVFDQGCTVTSNTNGILTWGNMVAAQNPGVSFRNGNIHGNSSHNVYAIAFGNAASTVLDFSSNWWGTTSVASIAGGIYDSGDDSISPAVDFHGYLASSGGSAAYAGGWLIGGVSTNRTLTSGTYQMLGNVNVGNGATLTIPADTTIDIPANFAFNVAGTLVAHGTSTAPVVFNSSKPTPARGDWSGVRVSSSGFVDFDHVTIEHAANGLYFAGGEGQILHTTIRNNTTGIYVEQNSAPVFDQQCTLTSNGVGLVAWGNSTAAQNPAPAFRNGSIYGNSSHNVYSNAFGNAASTVLDFTGNWWGATSVAVIAGSIYDFNESSISPVVNFHGYLGSSGGAPAYSGGSLVGTVASSQTLAAGNYQMLSNVNVANGATLTVPAGTTIESPGNFELTVNGTLEAHGTSTSPVAFRSSKASPMVGDWIGLRISNTGFIELEYVTIEHAENGLQFAGGEGLVSNTTLKNNYTGVLVEANSSPTFTAYSITSNDRGVVAWGNGTTSANPAPTFNDGAIYGNRWVNASADAFGSPWSAILNFRRNWWGSSTPSGVEAGVFHRKDGSTSSPTVDYLEFLSSNGGLQQLVGFDFLQSSRTVDSLAPATSTFAFTVNTQSHAYIDVVREDSDQVARSADLGTLAPGTAAFTWDGKDGSGQNVAEGLYRFVPRLEKSGATWSDDPPVPDGEGAMTADPFPSRFRPLQNEFWKAQYMNMPGYGQSGGTMELQITPPTGPMFKLFAKRYWAGPAEWVYWDGRDPQGNLVTGDVTLYFPTPKFLRPNHVRVLENAPRITGTQVAPAIEVKSDPYLITHSYEHLSRIAFRVSLDSMVSVKLLPPGIVDPDSPLAIQMLSPALLLAKDGAGAPIDHVVEWRGHEAADPNRMKTAVDGAYTFAITAVSTQTGRSTLYRGVLQIHR